jgi:ferredoxin
MNLPTPPQGRGRFLVIGTALVFLGIACLAGLPGYNADQSARGLTITLGAVLIVCGTAILLNQIGGRGRDPSLFRLDHFMPFVRRPKKGTLPEKQGWLTRAARRVLPARLFADPLTGKPGSVRRLLRRVGPSVLSSPGRRLVQAACFVLFLWLFFHVCWPYHARPDTPGAIHGGWRFAEIEEATGWLRMEHDRGDPDLALGQTVYLVDQGADSETAGLAGRFTVSPADGAALRLASETPMTDDQIDRLLLGVGPWALHESEPGRWPSHYADDLARKEIIPAETFLVIDPLVSLSTAITARSWVWSLLCAGIILLVCVFIPRGFCGYLCPLGTLIDLFDWALGKRVKRFRLKKDGWWVHLKYYVLLAVLASAFAGVLISGYVAAIPVITRGMLFLGEPLQNGLARDWHLVPPMNAGHVISLLLFLGVLALGLLRPRFWCKYVCPSGAVFSVANLFRVSERKVEDSCIHCNKCVEICPFDAIKPDFTTRVTDCTLCQTCGGVCPTHSIKFVERWNVAKLKGFNDPPTGETPLGRRGFLSLLAGSGAGIAAGGAAAAGTRMLGARLDDPKAFRPVRPPGSVPEREFLDMCIRCGECFKVCPNNVLHPEGFQQGLEGLWAPMVVADWAGCESSCSACGQVCPTGAIRALPLAEKKVARMGLAIVDTNACLPFANREACQLCVDECHAAGYHAIEFTQVHTEVDDAGQPVEATGYLAPVVIADKCVGCGLCQTRCYGINAAEKTLLKKSAIIIEAGAGKEDRLLTGSYRALRKPSPSTLLSHETP